MVPSAEEYRAAFQTRAQGVKTVLARDVTLAALKTIGAKRFGILSPMSNENSEYARTYYEGHGFEVPYTTALMVKKFEDISRSRSNRQLRPLRRSTSLMSIRWCMSGRAGNSLDDRGT